MRTSRCGAARAAVFDSVVLAMRLLCVLAIIYHEDTSALQYAARSACLLVRLSARVPPAGSRSACRLVQLPGKLRITL